MTEKSSRDVVERERDEFRWVIEGMRAMYLSARDIAAERGNEKAASFHGNVVANLDRMMDQVRKVLSTPEDSAAP